jgi:hypothetical protein
MMKFTNISYSLFWYSESTNASMYSVFWNQKNKGMADLGRLPVLKICEMLMSNMALPVMEFQDQGYKIRKIFA